MDFALNDEQIRLQEAVRAFARDELNDDLAARDAAGVFSEAIWRRCAEMGIIGVLVPAAYAGQGHDVVTAVVIMEALGYGCRDNGLTLGLNGQIWSVQQPLLEFGNAEQKARYLPALCRGEMRAADGITELDSGSDVFSMKTAATRVAGGYRLRGRKSFIGLAPTANLFLVLARSDPEMGPMGVSAFLLEAGCAGLELSPPRRKMGLNTNPLGDIVLQDCFVPEQQRLGPEGVGLTLFNSAMDWERSFIFASHVGAMAAQLDACVAFARARKQFGRSIGANQSISNRIADMRLRLETARLLLYKLAWMKQRGMATGLESAMANLHLAECFAASSLDAMRIHGARGYVSEYGVERDVRDSLGGLLYAGTSDIQRNIIAKLMGLPLP